MCFQKVIGNKLFGKNKFMKACYIKIAVYEIFGVLI